MLSNSTEFYLENAVRAKFLTFPTPFLTSKELELLEYIALCVYNRSLRNNDIADYEVASVVLRFVQYFRGRRFCYVNMLQYFCLWLQIFMKESFITFWEFKIVMLMFLQCKWFIKEDKVPLPDEQENEFMYSNRINDMMDFRTQIQQIKGISEKVKWNSTDLKNTLQGYHPTLYNDLQNAYQEGRTILKNQANVRALNSVMTATRVSAKDEEFAITGTHSGRTHRNSEGLIRGFSKDGGVKSVKPVYSNGENTLFHSHPSLSPISNNESNNPNFRVAGDIGHSYYGKKNIFAINNEGDIFYTNPKLAKSCIDFNNCANSAVGQVYLGNIKEFMR